MILNKVFLVMVLITRITCTPEHSRSKRFTAYSPYNTGIALAAALGIPVDNGRGNVFMSVCMQANYNQPSFPPLSPPLFQTIYGDTVDRKLNDMDFDDYSEDKTTHHSTNSNKRVNFKKLLDIITRRKFFKLIEHKLNKYGFDGESCILKAICDVSQHKYSQNNGVIGDIVHILFKPTTSKDEQMPLAYYEAEQHGESGRCNALYGKKCPVGIFDYVSFT